MNSLPPEDSFLEEALWWFVIFGSFIGLVLLAILSQ